MLRYARFYLMMVVPVLFLQAQTPVGRWTFDDAQNLLAATTGSALELVGTHTAVEGPYPYSGAVNIGKGSYYRMLHGIAPLSGNFVNEYSLQIDFRIAATGNWHCFFQTNPANTNDGDCFINTVGNIGVAATGYSSYAVKGGEWYRLIVSVKNGSHYRLYLDGELLLNGSVQSANGRFALESALLIFADEDGEDNPIDCAELAIWDMALTADQAAALGGFGHHTQPQQLTLIPYLQTPMPTSLFISWHDPLDGAGSVEYGTTEALGLSVSAGNELIASPYRWYTAKLTALEPNTEYYYKLISSSGESAIYRFRTVPDNDYTGKLRFVLLSDTHSGDTTMAVAVLKAVRDKVTELYGSDLQNQLTAVLHSGDITVSGSTISHYTDQFFGPLKTLTPYVPTMTVTGNHEVEHEYYYKYFKYDDVSAYPSLVSANERFWSIRFVNTLVIGLNSNIVSAYGTVQKTWLNTKLQEAQADSTIDFVLLQFHHMPICELWVDGLTYDAGPNWIKNEIVPVCKNYSKVTQITYGHTHAFERGTYQSNSEDGDFRMVCTGGGGGATDRWGAFVNKDYNEIHLAIDHYFFQLMEIDVEKQTLESTIYSLGNSSKSRDNVAVDHWYRKLNGAAPETPLAMAPEVTENRLIIHGSDYAGDDSLMTVRFQISGDSSFNQTLLDTMDHWTNVYGADQNFEPVDLNQDIDLTRLSTHTSRFTSGITYYYRLRYRDHNLRWSGWSNAVSFNISTSLGETDLRPKHYGLSQNYPNPFNPTTRIAYQLPENGRVRIRLFNALGQEVMTLVDEFMASGFYSVEFNAGQLSSGVYFYKMEMNNFSESRRLVLTR